MLLLVTVWCVVFTVWCVLCQGGVVARGLFTVPGFDHSLVHTIITQATPHQAPVVALDAALADYYSQVNTYWRTHKNTTLKDVTVVTSGGGYRDLLVRTGLTPVFGVSTVLSYCVTSCGVNP